LPVPVQVKKNWTKTGLIFHNRNWNWNWNAFFQKNNRKKTQSGLEKPKSENLKIFFLSISNGRTTPKNHGYLPVLS
jgi:hypothetical protein